MSELYKIKPLVWDISPTGVRRAKSPWGFYYVHQFAEFGFDWFLGSPGENSPVGTETEAMKGAETHYRARLMECLEEVK